MTLLKAKKSHFSLVLNQIRNHEALIPTVMNELTLRGGGGVLVVGGELVQWKDYVGLILRCD